MRANLEDVVAALHRRFDERGAYAHPSHAYSVAQELTNALTTSECQCQLQRLLSLFECDKEECAVAHVVAAGALVCGGVGAALSEEEERRWELTTHAMLTAHPPFSTSVVAAVCYCVAQMAVKGRCAALVQAAGTALCGGIVSSTTITEEAAMELLAQCADTLVSDRQKEQEKEGGDAITLRDQIASETALKDMLVRCALDALSCARGDAMLTSFLSRRVLIPLLLSDGNASLSKYDSCIQSLLLSLTADKAKQSEVVVLIAAAFEYVFRCRDGDKQRDYRCSPHLWDTLHNAFQDALTSEGESGHRANMQLRAEYLLKRVVDFTREQEVQEGWTQNVGFHRYFVWVPAVSHTQWGLFFLVLEATNEYGLHIIQPALPKLDVLVEQLASDAAAWKENIKSNNNKNTSNEDDVMVVGAARFTGGLHPVWVEMLYLKMLLHPNMAFRKMGLRRLWSLSTPLLQLFSSAFLFTNMVEVSLDSRLCAELDRTPHLLAFLGAKGFEGEEVRALAGTAGPLADQLERFYARIFRDVLCTADERREAMRRMLHVVAAKPSPHAATMLLRILNGVAVALAEDHETKSRHATLGMITDPGVLQELFIVLRDAAQENVPFWLDVRLNAMAFSALLHFARVNPEAARQSCEFWRLLCMCGPLGHSGGNGAVAVDSVGHVGSVGSCIDPCFLNDQLLRVSCNVLIEGNKFTFLRTILQSNRLLENVQRFLRASCFDEVQAKQLLFLSGAMHMAEPQDRQVLADVAREIATALCSLVKRPYSSPGNLLASLLAFVEFHHSVGTEASTQYFSLTTVVDMSEVIYTLAFSSLRQAIHAIAEVATPDDFLNDVWALQHTSEWDAVVAAMVSTGQIAASHDSASAPTRLQSRQRIEELVELLVSGVSGIATNAPSSDASCNVASHFAKMVVARNASRLLQGVLCGLIALKSPAANLQDVDIEAGVFCCCCCCNTDNADLPRWIRQLMCSPMLRLTSCDVPCLLTNLSWSTVLAQYYGGVYNAVFILCNAVDTRTSPDLVVELQEYGLDHVERCWGSNLTSVYGILSWVAAAAAAADEPKGVDHAAIIHAMFDHLNDVGAKEHGRVSVLAFNALRCGATENDDLIKSCLSRALLDEAESERSGYVAAVTIATEVMRDPEANWPRFKELLLHVAVLYNSSREEEASEVMVAATEPVLLAWSEALRVQYTPTVRLSTVGRALAISTTLWCCHLRPEWATELSLELLDWNTTHEVVSSEPCRPNSRSHRCRIRLWQMLCALLPMIDDADSQRKMLQTVIQKCLPLINMGSVRRLMELYALKLLESQPGLYKIIDDAMTNYGIRPQVCGSYVLIAAHTVLQQVRGKAGHVDGLFEAMLHRLFQQSTSHQHLLRIISHIGLYHIHEECLAKGLKFSPAEEMMFDYIARAPEHVRFRAKHAEQLFFDLAEASTPRQIFCIQRKEGHNILLESIPAAAFERMRFLDREFRSLTGALSPLEMLRVQQVSQHNSSHHVLELFKDFPYIPHTEIHAEYCVDYTAEALALLVEDNGLADGTNTAGGDENIQRKVTPWWNSHVYNELHPRALKTERQPLVVIGSLLQNPVNVAGLFRCGEIFTVEKIVVTDAAVFEHPHFVAAARSAELWLPWNAVPERDLPAYLTSLRQDGYTLIGVEQTASSVSMASYKFPERAVILLGAEGHGVPAALLPLLDVCVEIPQFGLIRSLNVHVTGAITMYEYTRQRLMDKRAS
ncbi:hypothetical protein DQ04_03111010 [Trypanosoma grayi]|uniref:hypothetical protein n=1 Tax=Trypanosoma grayi TaxID=71804 RepID=UPI0004F441B9|nr:hypothetical protein DQ04_03111010 [Trypanosoma grayi]KEG10956.1 hypothetical protein DQ04_03111010 [Trypanosoma grayi]